MRPAGPAASDPSNSRAAEAGPRVTYVVKRFPTLSETFIAAEVEELLAQGASIDVVSLRTPPAPERRLIDRTRRQPEVRYLRGGARGAMALVGATLRQLAVNPRRAWPAALWTLLWAARTRDLRHLAALVEAAHVAPRLAPSSRHLHAHFAGEPATVALLCAWLRGLPFSFTGHARDIFHEVPPALLAAKLDRARFAVAVTEHGRRHMRASRAGAREAEIAVVRAGIDLRRFRPRQQDPGGPPSVLAVSRLVPKKGLATLVDACGLLAARGREFRCLVAGDGPLRPELTARAQSLQLGERVTFLGSREPAEVRELYDSAWVFALPCQRAADGDQDGLPVAIMEALAVGVPVVTTPISGIPEAIEDGHSGLMVPPQDARALAAVIERLLDDESLRQRLARGGLERVASFDVRTSARRLRELFGVAVSAGALVAEDQNPGAVRKQ